MNNYLYLTMRKNSFYIKSCGNILGKDFNNVMFKIDTGCSFSTIPLKKLLVFNNDTLNKYKSDDILSGVKSMITYGVESGGKEHKIPETFDEKMKCEAIKFEHKLTNFSLGNYIMPDLNIYVNYNREGNILIGMDIIKLFDIHIGTSNITGKETLIAVLKSQKDKSDYYKALYEHFDLIRGSLVYAEKLRNSDL